VQYLYDLSFHLAVFPQKFRGVRQSCCGWNHVWFVFDQKVT
jgi:hypothetical protein